MKCKLVLVFLISAIIGKAQSYTSYFTGNENDIVAEAKGGVCLMGGASEDDNAMKWFLNRAAGGDVLVIRASGSDGYNDYLYSELGVEINSVESIVFHSREASYDETVMEKIRNAEAIWMAGGDQWKYISYWRDSPVDSLIQEGISQRNIVIGGTSAGMAVLGGAYFSAVNGTISSGEALSNPYDENLTVDTAHFLNTAFLEDVITDTHYDDRDRKGRHVVFLARLIKDYGMDARGIACDEYTAVCIDTLGEARIFGSFPDEDDNAYFIQSNCEVDKNVPEDCRAGIPLEWNRGGEALKVYSVKGRPDGSGKFNLGDWNSGEGGSWMSWYVQEGEFYEAEAEMPACGTSYIDRSSVPSFRMYPNPVIDYFYVSGNYDPDSLSVVDIAGRVHSADVGVGGRVNVSKLESGVYFLHLGLGNSEVHVMRFLVI